MNTCIYAHITLRRVEPDDGCNCLQALLKMYESLKAEHVALKARHKSTSEQNDCLRVSVL